MKKYIVSSKEQFNNLPSHHLEDEGIKTVVKIKNKIDISELQDLKNCHFINKGEDKNKFEVSNFESCENIKISGFKLIRVNFNKNRNIQIKDCEIYNFLMFFECSNINLENNIIRDLSFKSSNNININSCKTHEMENPSNVIDIKSSKNIKINDCVFSGSRKETCLLELLSSKDVKVTNTLLGECESFLHLKHSELVLNKSKIENGKEINVFRNSNLKLNKIKINNIEEDQLIFKDNKSDLEINNSPELVIGII